MSKQYNLVSAVIIVYSSVLEVLRKFLFPLLKKISDKKVWDLQNRQKLPSAVRDYRNRTVVWVHAASLGEAKLLFKFVEILEQRHPEDLYLITATTRTGVQYLMANRPGSVCAIGYLPIDTIPLMTRVIEHYSVTRLWLMETELWPSMLMACSKLGIPAGIVNARIEEKSFRKYSHFQWAMEFLFGCFDIVLAQNDDYAERFTRLGVKSDNVHVVGNIKGHVLIKSPSRKKWQSLRQALNINENHLVLTAGCVHAGEGRKLRECVDSLRENDFSVKLIVVPRHLDETSAIIEEIGGNVVHLQDVVTSCKWDMCVVEKMGILDDMYMVADAAFVGGTFVSTGGHNVWDAARFGIPVFFGPDYHTQIDGCEKLITAGVGFKAQNAQDLANQIFKVMKTDARRFVSAQIMFRETINKRQSVLEPLIP